MNPVSKLPSAGRRPDELNQTPVSDQLPEIIEGLRAPQKYIPSKFFYDREGSRIFQDIMRMPEYYLTDCETEIFETHGQTIASLFSNGHRSLDLVELGAGDGLKTRILIKEMVRENIPFRYIPIDISGEALNQLETTMKGEFKDLTMTPLHGDYFDVLEGLSSHYTGRKAILFLGSNLGNLDRAESISFLNSLATVMTANDLLFLGLDLKKDPAVIHPAYDDPHGLTREFNLNLLTRMNRELGGNFDRERFRHLPEYDPETGTARSYLVSLCDQSVTLGEAEETVYFRKGETIHTEMSQKYDLEMIGNMASQTGFKVVENLVDSREYFVNSLLRRSSV